MKATRNGEHWTISLNGYGKLFWETKGLSQTEIAEWLKLNHDHVKSQLEAIAGKSAIPDSYLKRGTAGE